MDTSVPGYVLVPLRPPCYVRAEREAKENGPVNSISRDGAGIPPSQLGYGGGRHLTNDAGGAYVTMDYWMPMETFL